MCCAHGALRARILASLGPRGPHSLRSCNPMAIWYQSSASQNPACASHMARFASRILASLGPRGPHLLRRCNPMAFWYHSSASQNPACASHMVHFVHASSLRSDHGALIRFAHAIPWLICCGFVASSVL